MGGLFGGGGQTISTEEPRIGALLIQTSAYGLPIPIVYGTTRISGNLIWYGDFTAIAHTETSSSGGGGKGGGGTTTTSTTYTYTTALQLGLSEGPGVSLGTLWAGKEQSTPAAKGFSTFLGTYPQSPWGYLTTNRPGEALGYQGLMHIDGVYDLGSSASLPNFSVEVSGRLLVGGGNLDAHPKDISSDFLTNVNYGVGFPAAKIGSTTLYETFCTAYGIWLSPALTAQQAAQQHLADLYRATNTAPVWSEGLLKLIPYCETAKTANGATYTPNITPQYDLTDDDFLYDSGADPVRVTHGSPADAYNRVTVEFLNRANQYNIETVEAKDQANIELYGLRPMDPIRLHAICNGAIAQLIAQMILQRVLYIRNTYEFNLGWRFERLEPMDIVTLTDADLGLDKYQVRITEIEDDEEGELSVMAEDFPFGVATPAVYPTQAANGYSVNYNLTPPNTNVPILFEAPVDIAASGLEVWLAVCGGANWGGCEVWVSSDNATYARVGNVYGSARMGSLSSDLGGGLDPDTINTLAVDLGISGGELYSGTLDDANTLRTLCYADGELLSYQTATLTAANKYRLTYLRRGAYGTANAIHLSGTKFARLDSGIFKHTYTKKEIGKTLYFKFPAFNQFGAGQQDHSAVAAYTHTIIGPPVPPNVSGFLVTQNGGSVVFVWQKVISSALDGYDIRYAAQGVTDWNLMKPLTEAAGGTEMTNASVPPGAWVFAIRAQDIAGQLSALAATYNLIVTNPNPVILLSQECPALLGAVSGFLKHWTGVLVPLGQFNCATYNNWQDFGVVFAGSTPYVPDPVASALYTTPVYDTGYNDVLRVLSIVTATPGPGVSGSPATAFSLDYWLTGQTDPNVYVPWVAGSAQMRYLKGRVTETPGVVPSYISVFTVQVDDASIGQSDGANLTVAAGGTAVTFSTSFREPPFVNPSVVSASALFATASGITKTGCTINVYNTSGVSVGGLVNWTAEGY